MNLTILMPCLNEEESIKMCIDEARRFIDENNIHGEVLVVDNGSTDSSVKIAKESGARVIECEQRGYGSALRCGIDNAKGEYIIMGDCDGSYNFLHLKRFTNAFKTHDIVIGNRYTKISEKGSLSITHKLGGMALSKIARLKTKNKVKDFHCGLRGGKTSILRELELNTDGFEFATEMIMKADKYEIYQFPIIYRKTTRNDNKSKLNPIRDGLRHLVYIWRYKSE